MNWLPWAEALAVSAVACAGFLLGIWFSRLRKPYWLLGYFIPLGLILIYGIAARQPALAIVPPVSWMMIGRVKFVVIGLITTMVLTTPLSRLRSKQLRILVSIMMALMVVKLSVWPFLAPAFNRKHLAGLATRIDENGICRQNSDYTCGPASAVTALRKLGFRAEEGDIAVLAHTSSAIGTPADILARALQDRYGREGLTSEYRVFRSLDELKAARFTLAVLRYRPMVDHYVTVLEVTNNHVLVGDPLLGLSTMSYPDFRERWRFVGVQLSRGN